MTDRPTHGHDIETHKDVAGGQRGVWHKIMTEEAPVL